jgi:quercetin dioxygenase-like cupin family protein
VVIGAAEGVRDAHVVVATDRFDDDFEALTAQHGFRVDAIFPADAPTTAIVSAHGMRLRIEASVSPSPIALHLLSDTQTGAYTLPGGSRLEYRPFTTDYVMPEGRSSLVISHDDGGSGVGRAGMRYRDLLPDRWGGTFVASHITIPEGGPVPDYVHFHKVRFQVIFVKSGWVRLVYEDQGGPFVMVAGDCVLQPPQIRHRVLESSPGLEVIEIGTPALHDTIADWALELPNGRGEPSREWSGQRFVRHVAADAAYRSWRLPGWEYRDTGIGDATGGIAGVRVARVTTGSPDTVSQDTVTLDFVFAMLVVLRGGVTFESDDGTRERLRESSSVAVPGGVSYRLTEATPDCELLDVTMPASA